MNPNIKTIVRFSIICSLISIFIFFAHQYVLEEVYLKNEFSFLKNSYVFNTGYTITVFAVILFIRNSFRDSIGFLFLFGSLTKFLLFFLLFYPSLVDDDKIGLVEFMQFFIPLCVCLIIEVYFLVKVLMKD